MSFKPKEKEVQKRSLFKMLAVAFAICLAFLAAPAKSAAQSSCSPTATYALDGGEYEFQMDEWNSTLEECATISGTNGFNITTASFDLSGGAPATYTSVYRGCHWGACTSSNPFPIQESAIASASTAVSITQPGGMANDSAYDIWFNTTPTTSGQPNGTEVMIWINHQGGVTPFGTNYGTVTIDGIVWNVYYGRQTSWNCISYEAVSGVTSANLNLLPFFSDSISRGQLESAWYLLDVEYGFEIWQGGVGLAVDSYSVSASATASGSGGTTLTSGDVYTFTPQNSTGLRLDDAGASTATGNPIQVYTANGTGAQNWSASTSGVVPAGYFNLATEGAYCLTASGTASGSAVVLDPCVGSSAQAWEAVASGTNYIFHPANNTANCLDVRGDGTASGTVVQAWACNGGNNEEWAATVN